LFQIEQGDCIGGFTSQHWESLSPGKFKADSSAFLFNLTRSRHFPSKATGTDLLCRSDLGICLEGGGGYSELVAGYEPFNGKDKCYSRANKPGYNISSVDGINQLTNQANVTFTISELEVWLLE
jgi:hypothetical protein